MNRRAKDLSLLIAGVALGAGVFWFLSDRPADRKTRSAAFEEHADHVLAEDDEVTTEVPERLMDRAQKTQRRRTEASGTSAAEPAGKKPAPDATVERDEEEAPAQVPRNEKNAAMAEKMLAQASSELSLGTLSLETVWTGPLDRTTGRYPEVRSVYSRSSPKRGQSSDCGRFIGDETEARITCSYRSSPAQRMDASSGR